MENKLNIKVISESSGIKPHTIRIWEKRYQVFTPKRSSSGQRLYNQEDLIKANLLATLVKKGHSISQLASLSSDELRKMQNIHKNSERPSTQNQTEFTLKLLDELANYKIDNVFNELEHLRTNLGARQFIFDVVLPTLRNIGSLVYTGNYTVTQEHIISTLIREQLGQITFPPMGDKNKEMILATPNGNMHELSILIANIVCKINKAPTRYLGASHPSNCLAEAINALQSPYLVLGVVSSDKWNFLDNIHNYLINLDSRLTNEVEILLGGGSEIQLPNFQKIKKVYFLKDFEEFDRFTANLF